MTSVAVSPEVAEKVQRLLSDRRVLLVEGRTAAIVVGDSDIYTVTATETGVTCTCVAQGGYCSHVIAAMAEFHDHTPWGAQ